MKIAELIKQFNDTVTIHGCSPVLTGFKELDGLFHGLKPGELCIIGGRPAMGKTAFVLSLIRNLASRNNPVALFSVADSPNLRFLSRVVCNLLNKEQSWKTEDNLKVLSESDLTSFPLHLYADPKITISFLRNTCKELVEKQGVKCIFIETIQGLFATEFDGFSKSSMEMICIELKRLAIELNMPVVVTSDLNRGPEHRKGIDGKRPQIQDIRLSNAIENIADSIWLIFRPSYYLGYVDENGNDIRTKAIVSIIKNKYDACGELYLTFNNAKCSFEDVNVTDIKNAKEMQYLIDALDLEQI